eukprot:3030950-Prymnesium_polylepis.2
MVGAAHLLAQQIEVEVGGGGERATMDGGARTTTVGGRGRGGCERAPASLASPVEQVHGSDWEPAQQSNPPAPSGEVHHPGRDDVHSGGVQQVPRFHRQERPPAPHGSGGAAAVAVGTPGAKQAAFGALGPLADDRGADGHHRQEKEAQLHARSSFHPTWITL